MSVTITEETTTTYVVKDKRGNTFRTPHRDLAEEYAFTLRCLYWCTDGFPGPCPQRTNPTPRDNRHTHLNL